MKEWLLLISYSFFGLGDLSPNRISEIRRLFLEQGYSYSEIQLEGIELELVRPENTLPHFQRYPYAEIRSLMTYADTCTNPPKKISPSLSKAYQWHRSVCLGEKLNNTFFESPPYMHPKGKSFVVLAHREKEFPRYQHLLETKKFSYLSLEGISRNEAIVLGLEDRIYFYEHKAWGPSAKFFAYNRNDWELFIKRVGFATAPLNFEQNCRSKDFSLCWKVHPEVVRIRRLGTLLAVALGLLLLVSVLYLVIERRKSKQKEAEARYFLLQTLTHELRTPVTTLQLCVEAFRKDFDQLNGSAQKNFLRLCDETQRLNRMVQDSIRYLNSHGDGIRFEYEPVDSINTLVAHWLDPYLNCIEFEPLQIDRGASVDKYWLNLCLKNLVANALSHGKPPVKVKLENTKLGLNISVSDGGSIQAIGIDSLLRTTTLRNSSKGLGLGLSIVKTTVERMHGTLTYLPSPTRFIISLREA